jgi:hypothetical protein
MRVFVSLAAAQVRLYVGHEMDDKVGAPKRKKKRPSPPCAVCSNPMTFITTIADPLMNSVRLFECPKCRNTVCSKEPVRRAGRSKL